MNPISPADHRESPPRSRAGSGRVAPTSIAARIHVALACAYLFLLPLLTAPKDAALALLCIVAIARLGTTWRSYAAVARAPIVWLLFAWLVWHGLSIAWSSDVEQGLDEWRTFRVVLVPLVLWPGLDRVTWLIAAFLAGVAAHNIVQGMQLSHLFGLEPDKNGRLDGLIHAIQLGAMCASAMCWQLAAVLRGSGPFRWLSLAGLLMALAGLIFTGSRGPWLAALVALPLTAIMIVSRGPSGISRRVVLAIASLTLVGAVAAWIVAGPAVSQRISEAIDQSRAALSTGDFDSNVGLRLANWMWSIRFFRDHPVIGIGAGSFQDSVRQTPEYRKLVEDEPDDAEKFARDHAHSTYLQILSGQGLIGALVLASLLLLAIHQAWRDPDDHVYAVASLGALVSWIIGGLTDCYHLNGHTFGLLAMILAVTLPRRPASREFQPLLPRLATAPRRESGADDSC
jgi:hypothetical protein